MMNPNSVPTLHNNSIVKKRSSSSMSIQKTGHGKNSGFADMKNASIETLLNTAANVVEDHCAVSDMLSKNNDAKFPKFEEHEVTTGKVLGRGGFCVVRSVEKLHCNGVSTFQMANEKRPSCMPWLCGGSLSTASQVDEYAYSNNNPKMFGDENNDEDDIRLTRDYVASQSRQKTQSKTSRYVIKTVSSNCDKITYMKGCVDIAMECKFLASLDHHNIIRLVACSKSEPCTPGYFIVLERMNETLHQRIKAWMDQDRHNKSVLGFLQGKNKELKLYRSQIAAAYDISEALYYLHSNNIIFRDLKPENIGFDSYNVLKLFDFGLAKELREEDKGDDGLYRNLTKCTGAIRYMAPEVGLGRPYNLSADAYSWAHLLWFMLALEPPYGMYTEKMIFERVMRKGARPLIFRRWRDMIKDIMSACWDNNIAARPTFLEISLCLKQELIDCEGAVEGGSSTVQNTSYHGEDELNGGGGSFHQRRDQSQKQVDEQVEEEPLNPGDGVEQEDYYDSSIAESSATPSRPSERTVSASVREEHASKRRESFSSSSVRSHQSRNQRSVGGGIRSPQDNEFNGDEGAAAIPSASISPSKKRTFLKAKRASDRLQAPPLG